MFIKLYINFFRISLSVLLKRHKTKSEENPFCKGVQSYNCANVVTYPILPNDCLILSNRGLIYRNYYKLVYSCNETSV